VLAAFTAKQIFLFLHVWQALIIDLFKGIHFAAIGCCYEVRTHDKLMLQKIL
jgi:hypothetical protein